MEVEQPNRAVAAPSRSARMVLAFTAISIGIMGGYVTGVAGGVAQSDRFLVIFFPELFLKKLHTADNNICVFHSQKLQAFISIVSWAALVGLIASYFMCLRYGRRVTLLCASLVSSAGVIATGIAPNALTLYVGRFLQGLGNGLAFQAIRTVLSTVPAASGGTELLFDGSVIFGELLANVINFATSVNGWLGWRISLLFAALPSVAYFILNKILTSMTLEYSPVIQPSLETLKAYSPELGLTALMQTFFQWTGVEVLILYMPLLLEALNYSGEGSFLVSAVLAAIVFICATVFAFRLRHTEVQHMVLFVLAWLVILCCQGLITLVLYLDKDPTYYPRTSNIYVLLGLMTLFAVAFGCIFNPKGFLRVDLPPNMKTTESLVTYSSSWISAALAQHSFLWIACTFQQQMVAFRSS